MVTCENATLMNSSVYYWTLIVVICLSLKLSSCLFCVRKRTPRLTNGFQKAIDLCLLFNPEAAFWRMSQFESQHDKWFSIWQTTTTFSSVEAGHPRSTLNQVRISVRNDVTFCSTWIAAICQFKLVTCTTTTTCWCSIVHARFFLLLTL